MDDTFNIDLYLTNLEIPGYPNIIEVDTGFRKWFIEKISDFEQAIKNLRKNPTCCAITYSLHLESTQPEVFSATKEIFSEIMHICICLSYLSGQAITIKNASSSSDMHFLKVGDGYPRERHPLEGNFIEQSTHKYADKLNTMIKKFCKNEIENNINIIILHLLDSMYFWSLEDLFIGLCTILEIIKQNEIRRRKRDLTFYSALDSAAKNLRVSKLTHNVIKMRNDLIHYGKLSAINFPNKSRSDCAKCIEEAGVWIDNYIHALFSLDMPCIKRAIFRDLHLQNSYTVW